LLRAWPEPRTRRLGPIHSSGWNRPGMTDPVVDPASGCAILRQPRWSEPLGQHRFLPARGVAANAHAPAPREDRSVKISDIRIKTFRPHADRRDTGHALPVPRAELMQTVLIVATDEGDG
jgi:hypothetical protein